LFKVKDFKPILAIVQLAISKIKKLEKILNQFWLLYSWQFPNKKT
jgi:hypothetical protein